MLKRISTRLLAPFQLFYWKMATPEAGGAKVLIEYDGKYLLLRSTIGQNHWTLPGGRSKGAENPETTAKRKVKEEVGIALGALVPLGTYYHTRQGKKDVVCAYYAAVSMPQFHINTNVTVEAGWFTVAQMHTMTRSESVDDVLELYTKYQGEK
ncbi:MAG: NUDIX hydrolase [Patescibacteria group bacterium]